MGEIELLYSYEIEMGLTIMLETGNLVFENVVTGRTERANLTIIFYSDNGVSVTQGSLEKYLEEFSNKKKSPEDAIDEICGDLSGYIGTKRIKVSAEFEIKNGIVRTVSSGQLKLET